MTLYFLFLLSVVSPAGDYRIEPWKFESLNTCLTARIEKVRYPTVVRVSECTEIRLELNERLK